MEVIVDGEDRFDVIVVMVKMIRVVDGSGSSKSCGG